MSSVFLRSDTGMLLKEFIEERDIIERLYFNDETVRSVAKLKSITHPALIKRRNKILEKLKKFIEEL